MITVRQDSSGNSYGIWKQNQMSSCAVASVWMARNLARQQTMREGEWALAQRMFRTPVERMMAPLGVDPNGPMCLNPGSFAKDGSTMASKIANVGFMPSEIVQVLKNEGFSVQVENSVGTNPLRINTTVLSDTIPAIVGVYWKSGGGHAVVAARQAKTGRIVFLDPWDASLTEQMNNGTYQAMYGMTGVIGVAIYLTL